MKKRLGKERKRDVNESEEILPRILNLHVTWNYALRPMT